MWSRKVQPVWGHVNYKISLNKACARLSYDNWVATVSKSFVYFDLERLWLVE